MMTEHEWQLISEKAFPSKNVKAPAFLWTRILAAIESEEMRRAGSWWMQWRWMSRLTVASALVIGLGTFYFLSNSAIPLDAALEGRTAQHQALELARTVSQTDVDASDVIVGLDS